MFDKLKIGASAKLPAKFVPVHPDPSIGDKHGIALYLHGKHSEEYRNAIAAMLRRQKEGSERTVEDAMDESSELIAACCASYDIDDKPAKFDRVKLLETLRADDYRWMRIQAERFIQTDSNYFPKPSGK